MSYTKYLYGVTLIELLISMIISTIVMSIIIFIFITTNKNFQLQNALNTMQENERAAIYELRTHIQTLGYMGCSKWNGDMNNIVIQHDEKLSSDIITIRYADYENAYSVENDHDDIYINVETEKNIAIGDVFVISNCLNSELLKIQNIYIIDNKIKIIPESKLLYHYNKYTELYPLRVITYFIADTGRKDKSGHAVYGLYRKSNQMTTEIAEGISEMHVMFDPIKHGLSLQLVFTLYIPIITHKIAYLYVTPREE